MSTTDPSTAALPRNFIRPCILLLLREEATHGYDLLERLRVLGFTRDDPGRLYRALRTLEEEGLVRSAWEASDEGPDRRIYELTRAGVEALHASARDLVLGRGVLDAFLSRYEEFVEMPRPGARRQRAAS